MVYVSPRNALHTQWCAHQTVGHTDCCDLSSDRKAEKTILKGVIY